MSKVKLPKNKPKKAVASPLISILRQYVKDFSFSGFDINNADSPQSNPHINININVNANHIGGNDFKVDLKFDIEAEKNGTRMFKLMLIYVGIFRLENIAKSRQKTAIFVECPHLLFPFARQIIADITRNGGFPSVFIDPIDFANLFAQKLQQQEAANNLDDISPTLH